MNLFLAGIVMILFSVDGVKSIDDVYYIVCKNHYAASRIIETRVEERRIFCSFYCARYYWCRAVTITPKNGGYECQYHDGIFNVDCNSFPVIEDVRLLLRKDVYVMPMTNRCYNGASFVSPNCVCAYGFTGNICERYIRDCKEGKDVGMTNIAGITPVMIQPSGSNLAFEARCNFANGQTLVLFRDDRAYNTAFNRSWNEYKFSFGAPKNYWMGLESIYNVLQQSGTTFRLQVWCMNRASGVQISTYYTPFNILSESSLYAKESSVVSGASGSDGLGVNAVSFCTYDSPCSGYPDNNNGGWWYDDPSKRAYAMTNPQGSIHWLRSDANFHTDLMTIALEKTAG